ncbi:Uncharacterised protein [Chlamydia abortus]|uniref:Prenyltransferase n=1 Tax=Paenibacillus residui TaxID=629724 RepID=A0ABW3DEA5_9BACL|nr:Uncharacterised protein [Chlamydia abortus]
MNQTIVERAKSFIYNHGRLLDRRRFEYFFEGGSKEAVISALQAYQNHDGGFGNALEPDIRCPHSQPVATEVALLVMDEMGCFDRDIIRGIVCYLKKITVSTGGFPIALRELNEYPHAPWWTVKSDPLANINPTGQIMGLLLKQNEVTDFYEEEWFQQTLQYLWDYVDREEPSGYHDGVQWISFLEHAPDRQRAEAILATKVDKWLSRQDTIERNPAAKGYVHKVLDWASSRECYAAKFISEEEFKQHLSHLVEQQQEDGGWPMSWQEVSLGAALEWRGGITVERLKTLKSYGVL